MRYTYEHPLMERERDGFLSEVFQRRGMISHVASELGVSKQAVSKWFSVPEQHVPAVARLLGVTQYQVRSGRRP